MSHTLLPRILVTGFAPFGGDTTNPSLLLAQALHDQQIGGHVVIAGQLPCVFGDALETLAVQLRRHRPVLVLCLGQAGGRAAICMERVAINLNDARIPDNAQQQPIDQPVIAEGPAAYFSNLPVKAMALAAREAGVAAEVSLSAGSFVCNHVFYGLMHTLATRRALAAVRGGFVHVPYLPEQAERLAAAGAVLSPSMPLAQMVTGLQAALAAAVAHSKDLSAAEGSLH